MASELDWIFGWVEKGGGPNGECWAWQRSRFPKGYGQQRISGRTYRAHHIAFAAGCGLTKTQLDLLKLQFGNGNDNLQIGHHCDNPCCCNPEHLILWTGRENIADRETKGRTASGEQVSLRGNRNGSRTKPERIPRGDQHYSRTQPERLARGERHGMYKGPDQMTSRVFELRAAGWLLREIAADVGLSRPMVGYILNGKARRPAPQPLETPS